MASPSVERRTPTSTDDHLDLDAECLHRFSQLGERVVAAADDEPVETRRDPRRVTHLEERYAEGWPALRAKYLAAVSTARFPQAEGRTSVILPMFFSGAAARPTL